MPFRAAPGLQVAVVAISTGLICGIGSLSFRSFSLYTGKCFLIGEISSVLPEKKRKGQRNPTKKLLEIANKCHVHRPLQEQICIESRSKNE